MFKIRKTIVVVKKEEEYCSFPDIIQSRINPDKILLVYREGTAHHPEYSNLIVMESLDRGETWKEIYSFNISLEQNKMVWNCPRFSYLDWDHSLNIICDTKDSTIERTANFKTFLIKSFDDGKTFNNSCITPIQGMVPDKIFSFKKKLFLGNHKIKSSNNDLLQLINWSRDNGRSWYDCNVVADSVKHHYCEGSFIGVNDDYIISYLRDNAGHYNPVYTTKSTDGINWSNPEPLGSVLGHRVTAIRDEDMIIGAFRNTSVPCVSLFYHPIGEEKKVKVFKMEKEYDYNLYHFGYTGIVKIDKNRYLVAYYIKREANNPFIKLSFVERS